MDEIKFVLRCFLFACLLFAISQLKTEGITLESRLHGFLISTPVAEFVNNSAHGAVKFIQKSTNEISALITGFANKPEKSKQTNNKDIDLSEEEEF